MMNKVKRSGIINCSIVYYFINNLINHKTGNILHNVMEIMYLTLSNALQYLL